ncbi:MFS transporter [Spirochaetia bacterium]|nr:MFS transporter [Spirochaetia bacterium]
MEETKNEKWQINFLIIAISQAISLLGSGAVQFVLIWWIVDKTGSALSLTYTTVLSLIPSVFIGPFAGALVDRLKRKTVIISADLFTGVIALLFSLLFSIGEPPVYMIGIVLFMRSIGNIFHSPAIQATMPLLVPKEQLIKANSINQFLGTGSFLLCPILGAAMYDLLPMKYILLSDFAGALIACTAILIIKIPELPIVIKKKPNMLREIKEGLIIYMQDKQLFLVTIILCIALLFLSPTGTFLNLIVGTVFHGSVWHVSASRVLSSIGALVSFMVIGIIGAKIKDKLNGTLFGIIIVGLSAFIVGILPHNNIGLNLLLIVCLFFGAGMNIYNIPYRTYIQENIPREKLGRVFSLYSSLMSLLMPIGLIITGPIAEKVGMDRYFIIAGLGSMATIIIGKIILKIKKL